MIRRIAGFLSAALVASTLAIGAASAPAQAAQICVGTGTAQLTNGITLLDPFTSNPFSFTVDAGASVCVPGGITVTGSSSGTGCITTAGSGAVSGAASGPVSYVTVGPILVATGAITGVAVIMPDVLAGSDCLGVLGPNAKNFRLGGVEFQLP